MRLRSKSPPLLERMTEIRVGELLVRRRRIIEPRTMCTVARNFPNDAAAVTAAREMNDVADWLGVLKTRAEGGRPNCQDELRSIAQRHGGEFGDGGGVASDQRCAEAVAALPQS